ncbi:MAG TPA: pyrroline-5-carboxylate reductase [Mariprofundaceae bacterium]|nr:pyrroline-5-carboxylate reductase [Mariprofundaceae bacterium]
MQEMKIGFAGAGNMAEALIAGLIRAGHQSSHILVTDIREERLQQLRQTYGVQTVPSNAVLSVDSDVLVLAVKPQQMQQVVKEMVGHVDAGTTVISIAAGISTETLEQWFKDQVSLVRVMPNTPCLVNEGMSVLFSKEDETHRRRAEYILTSSGKTAWVDDENLLHAVTAISGSGPAYFFLLAELMQVAAHSLGLPKDLAQTLVKYTALGAGRMLVDSGKTPEELRQQVISPGGTTQAAMETMFEADLPKTVRAAIAAAAKRSRELG